MKRSLVHKLAIGTAVGAMALGAAACEAEGGGDTLDPGMEEGGEDLGGEGEDLGGEGEDLGGEGEL